MTRAIAPLAALLLASASCAPAPAPPVHEPPTVIKFMTDRQLQAYEGVSLGAWHGQQSRISSYSARSPVMGPFVEVFLYNRADVVRRVSVWAYLSR